VVQDAYLVMLALAIAVAVRFGAGQGFATTPLDVLLVITVVAAGTLGFFDAAGGISAGLLLRMAVLFYGCELTVSSARNPARANEWSLVGVALVLLGKILSIA
jgi:UDP-GlcNAc:undecaprenyl-phosphate GlcNAc-1-phosphate transferase